MGSPVLESTVRIVVWADKPNGRQMIAISNIFDIFINALGYTLVGGRINTAKLG